MSAATPATRRNSRKSTHSDAISIKRGGKFGSSGEIPSRLVAIVEDDVSVLESLEGLLESAGHEATLCSSGEEFLGSGRLQDIDCLVSDIGLPGMNGIELLREVQALRPDLPVVVITARDALVQSALNAGACRVFLKPLNSTDLLAAIAEL